MDRVDKRYVHFLPEERPFLARVEDWLNAVEKNRQVCTPFLDPRQAFILESLARARGVEVFFNGGHEHAERKKAILAPWPLGKLTEEDFGMVLVEARLPLQHASSVSHRHFLGSLLNLGLKREKFGDLWLVCRGDQKAAQVIMAEEVTDYVLMQWLKVGNQPIRVEKIPWTDFIPPKVHMEELTITLSSLRLDAFVSEVCRISRAKAAQLVREKEVKVNWKVEAEASATLQAGDLVSVRRYGRFTLLSIAGENRRGRLRLLVGKTV